MRVLPEYLPTGVAQHIMRLGLGDVGSRSTKGADRLLEFVEELPRRGGHLALKGWRFWYRGERGLKSGFRGRGEPPWPKGTPLKAVCIDPKGHHRDCEPPNIKHYCGIRAMSGPSALRHRAHLPTRAGTVVGEVILWGKVIRKNKMMWARFAYPMSLYLVEATFGTSAELVNAENDLAGYGVPICPLRSIDDLRADG